ncbi:U3 small nucleolar RNA-associated protein 14-like isoform X1 [Brassica napus]|uniref:U3 small nucleolar RNA-associated protein 14-like isoform X1 n=1 Tax=Brassica napus TaxID=3708 RepID=UPI00207911B3|nr:U3 small nucleolar RNA-associated protein 14-like isoform X1 [Brassica napus]
MGGLKRKSSSSAKALAKSKKKKGPHLPNSILKVIANQKRPLNSDEEDDDDVIGSDDEHGGDLYEYEEGVPEEESRKNNRYDRHENYDYELPEDFEDENVESEDDDDGGNTDNDEAEGDDDDDDDRHTRMLQSLTGMPSAAFEGESKSKPVLFTEAYPEGEFNPTRDVLEGKNVLTEEDFLAPLEGTPGYQKTSKQIARMRKDTKHVVHAPLPKPQRERLERKAVIGLVDEEFSKWVHLVKKNREAPTVYFNQDVDLGYSTVGAIASEFQPRTEFEKKMASVLNDSEVSEAHRDDGARLLELNEVSMEDHIKDHNHIAKMRSLLFRHEFKSKRIKKIKSKTYHRLKNKDLKNSSLGALMDPEMAKEEAMRQEAKRVEERMTLKHRNTGKWAKRMISRGLNVKYDGPKAAIAEQLQMNANLSRKMNSMRDGSSSDESDDEEEFNDGSDEDTPSRLIAKAKEKTLKALEDDEVPNAGLMSLPFMARAMKKKNEEANEEAKRALEEYEEWENSGGENSKKSVTVSGRRVFGATAKVEAPKESRKDSDNFYDDSDSDNDMARIEDNNIEPVRDNASPARNTITETEKFDDDVAGNPASKTTFDVAMFASGSWKKMTGSKNTESKKASKKTRAPIPQAQDKKGPRDEESGDSESEAEQMVDGVLTSTSKETFEVPSQAELINRAFAGDDVLDEFEKDKEEVLNQEVPKPEKPVLVPGWGDWTNIQKKRGISKQMVQKHDAEKKEWEQGLKTRKDARLKHVIISEKVDKKAEKLHTTTLPFPFTSKEVFEHSMRMPIGPEFNPSTIVGELNRPEVVKKTGVIIKPVKFEEVNPNDEVDDEHPRNHQKQRPKKKTSRRQGKVKSK